MAYAIFLVSYVAACAIGYFAMDIYLPALPIIMRDLNTNQTMVKLTLSSYLLSFSITAFIAGSYSDKIGRKKVILRSLSIACLGSALCCLSTHIYMLIIGRFFQGLGLGGVTIVGRALAVDKFSGESLSKVLSLTTMVTPVFLCIAPPLGGYITEFIHWRMVFVFVELYIVLLFAYFFFFYENSNHPTCSSRLMDTLLVKLQMVRNKPFMLYASYPVLGYIGITIILATAPFLFQHELGLTPGQYGSLTLVVALAVVIAGMLNMKMTTRFTAYQRLHVNMMLILASGLSMIVSCYLYRPVTLISVGLPLWLLFFSLAFGYANSGPAAYALVHSHYGVATSIMGFIQIFSAFVATSVLALIPNVSFMRLGYMITCLGLLTLGYLRLLKKYQA